MRVGWVEKVVAVTMWVENSFSFFKILQRGKVETVMLHRLAQVVLAYLIIQVAAECSSGKSVSGRNIFFSSCPLSVL